MDFKFDNFPEDRLQRIAYCATYKIEERIADSINIIKNEYHNYEKIMTICDFVSVVWFDTIPGNSKILKKVGAVPINQAKTDFFTSIEQIILTDYRSAYDSMRRMFEMAILQIYFSLDSISKDSVEKWKMSKAGTPNFSTMVKTICENENYRKFNSIYNIEDNAKKLYWNLCNKVHIKGIENSYMDFSITASAINDIPIKDTNTEIIFNLFNTMISIFNTIVPLYAIYNPVVLIGLPLFEKFGKNPPISGFLYPKQSEIIWILIDEKYKSFFEEIKENNNRIKDTVEWIYNKEDVVNGENIDFEDTLKSFAMKEFLSRYIK